MSGGPERRCVGRVSGVDGAVSQGTIHTAHTRSRTLMKFDI